METYHLETKSTYTDESKINKEEQKRITNLLNFSY